MKRRAAVADSELDRCGMEFNARALALLRGAVFPPHTGWSGETRQVMAQTHEQARPRGDRMQADPGNGMTQGKSPRVADRLARSCRNPANGPGKLAGLHRVALQAPIRLRWVVSVRLGELKSLVK